MMTFHVGNLSPEVTDKVLRAAFEAHGDVSSVSLPGDRMHGGRSGGAHRGYGFVVMKNRSQARAALKALDQRPLGGQTVSVRAATPPHRPEYVH